MADNVAAYRRWLIRPRVLVDVSRVSTATTVLGHELAMPILVAPVAFQRVAHPEGEVAMARAVAAAGTVMCLSTMATADLGRDRRDRRAPVVPAVRAAGPGPAAAELVAGAAEAGFSALVLTVDTPVLGRRERDHRTGFSIEHLLGLGRCGTRSSRRRTRSTRSPRR